MLDNEFVSEIRQTLHDLRGGQERMERKLNSVCTYLNGPDDEPEKGLKVRFDRVEQVQKNQKWWAGTAITAALGACATGLWAVLTGK